MAIYMGNGGNIIYTLDSSSKSNKNIKSTRANLKKAMI